jgi:D-tyrosyl-tRNA(Tyr) deacylase
MVIAIIRSSVDQASVNIVDSLLEMVEVEKEDEIWMGRDFFIYGIEDTHIYHDDIDEELKSMGLKPDVIIFASRHRSEAELECLTVHPIGNFSKPELGGKEALVPAPAHEMFLVLGHLLKSEYRADYEVTHHGPYLRTPSFFVEIGSSETQWNDPERGKAVALALAHLLRVRKTSAETAISIGGGHYAPRQTALVSESIAFGHMLPRYAYRDLPPEKIPQILDEMVAKTIPKPERILLESVPRWIRAMAEERLDLIR